MLFVLMTCSVLLLIQVLFLLCAFVLNVVYVNALFLIILSTQLV